VASDTVLVDQRALGRGVRGSGGPGHDRRAWSRGLRSRGRSGRSRRLRCGLAGQAHGKRHRQGDDATCREKSRIHTTPSAHQP
jgi:hypothetical protein